MICTYLIFEKSSWNNQVWQTGFLVYFELDFYCLCSLHKSILKLILQVKNPVRRTWFFKLNFSEIKYRSTWGEMNSAQFMHHFNETLRSDQVAINILYMTFLLLGLATNEAYILVSSILLVSQSWQDQKCLWSFKLDINALSM